MTQTCFYLALAGLIWFTAGLLALLAIYGLQRSISEFYYCLSVEKKVRGILFYVWFIVTVFLMLVPMVEAAGLWGFLACVGLAFTGAAGAFKEESQKWVHFGGAFLAAVSSVVLLWRGGMLGYYVQPLIVAAIAAVGTRTLRSSLVFWLETVAFYALLPAIVTYFTNL